MNQDLRSYVRSGSSEAFAKIVEAHVDAVYSQCLRQLRNSALAEDITQMVFIALAKKAATIPDHIVLGGWLFKATRYCCQNVQRSEMRRRKREQKVASMRSETIQTPHAPSDADQAEGLLDDAIACLSTRDRDAILLRYFQGKSVRDLAEVLRISEDAAKQRVNRAVERLRNYFADHGVAMPSVAMVGLLDAAVKPAAPSVAKAVIVTATAKSAGAAMAKVGSSWFTLSVSKIATTIAAAALITSAAIVGEHVASAGSADPPPVVAQETPTTQPTSQATPIGALRKLSIAIRGGNLSMIDDCLSDQGSDPETAALVHSLLHADAAGYRFNHAWTAKFAVPVSIPSFGFNKFAFLGGGFEALIDKTLEAGPRVKIDGETAMVRVGLPREAFTGPGNLLPEFGHWSGAMLVLIKVDGQWKLSIDHTIAVILNIDAPASTNTRLVTARKVWDGLGDALNQVAGNIENGTLATPADAGSAMHDAAMQAFTDCGVSGLHTMCLPVIGG